MAAELSWPDISTHSRETCAGAVLMSLLTCAWVGGAKPGALTQGAMTSLARHRRRVPEATAVEGADGSLEPVTSERRWEVAAWGGAGLRERSRALRPFSLPGRPCPSLPWAAVRVGDGPDTPPPCVYWVWHSHPAATLDMACLARLRRCWWSRPL